MKSLSASEILQMGIAERIQLVEDIWDSIAAVPDAIPLTHAQREELDRRIAAYHDNPQSGSPWDEVKKRLSGLA
ncbi:MAG: addiction module protein [Acidobacteriia bacterium]|nr:addiction module protein [Terriglobia bacterium]